MVLSHLEPIKSCLVGGWQTKFNVSPGPGFLSRGPGTWTETWTGTWT